MKKILKLIFLTIIIITPSFNLISCNEIESSSIKKQNLNLIEFDDLVTYSNFDGDFNSFEANVFENVEAWLSKKIKSKKNIDYEISSKLILTLKNSNFNLLIIIKALPNSEKLTGWNYFFVEIKEEEFLNEK